MKSRNLKFLEPSGPLQASNGTALPFTATSSFEVKDNVGQNATSLLVGYSYGVNETTCFGLLGGHHQVYKC